MRDRTSASPLVHVRQMYVSMTVRDQSECLGLEQSSMVVGGVGLHPGGTPQSRLGKVSGQIPERCTRQVPVVQGPMMVIFTALLISESKSFPLLSTQTTLVHCP
jgi:hypothetical protein